jgi:hypothetical protein
MPDPLSEDLSDEKIQALLRRLEAQMAEELPDEDEGPGGSPITSPRLPTRPISSSSEAKTLPPDPQDENLAGQ